jgi:ABC-type uncharacterized transport system substrate-binding protein
VGPGNRVHSSRLVRMPFHRAVSLGVLLCFTIAPAASARVVLLVERSASIYEEAAQGFQQGFGSTDQVDRISLEADESAAEAQLDSLRRNPPRLVIAIGTQAARIVREHLPNVPVLYCLALRPEQNHLVGPGAGGIVLDVTIPQQLENIQKALPQVRRIGVVYDELISGRLVRQARQYLKDQKADIQLVPRAAHTPQEAAQEIQYLMSNMLGSVPGGGGEGAFWMLWDPVTANPANFRLLVELSLRYQVPLIAPARPFVEAGALISVGANYEQAGRQAAIMARQVLEGQARPGNFEAVPPSDVLVTINGEVARRLGIVFPPDLRADVLAPAVGARGP